MAINQQLLALRFQERTGVSEAKAKEHTRRYIWFSALQLLTHINKPAGSRYYIDQTHLQNTLNTVQVSKKRHYVWSIFQSFPERIFDIVQTGSNLTEKLSMAHIRYTMEEVLLAAGTPEELAVEVYRPYNEQIQADDYDQVSINQRSLGNYIKSNLAIDRDANPNQAEDLDANLKHAQRIWMLATANDGQLLQVRSPSAFGRRYYRGPNLQNIPKIVRHAALGACHEYDIESSVFAWKLSWFKSICADQGETIARPATLEYLDHKSALRRRLAQTVFDTDSEWAQKIIKELITAIGFGAPARKQGYKVENHYQRPALATIITAPERLERALSDPWLREFVKEQTEMNSVIIEFLRMYGHETTWRTIPELVDKANRLRPNSVVAYLYQQQESKILDWVESQCESSEVLLTVHDCIYTRRPVNLLELRAGLKDFGEYYTVSHTHHTDWLWEDQSELAEHRQRIAEEEAHAASVFGTHTRPQAVKHSVPAHSQGETQCYDGSGHDGSGYDNYSQDDDPFFDDMSVEERKEYQLAREAVLPQPKKLTIYEQLGLKNT